MTLPPFVEAAYVTLGQNIVLKQEHENLDTLEAARPVDVPRRSAKTSSKPVFAAENCGSTYKKQEEVVEQPLELVQAARFRGPCDMSSKRAGPQPPSSGLAVEKLQGLSMCRTEFEALVLATVESLIHRCAEDTGTSCDVDRLGRMLKQRGYSVWVRTALGGGRHWFRQLHHSFLLVEGDPQYPDQLYVVDPNFRDQFAIARATRQYDTLLSAVPSVFVGRGKKLLPTIQLMCEEIAVAFSQQHLEVPPWRRRTSMMSKWMPERKTDYVPQPLSG